MNSRQAAAMMKRTGQTGQGLVEFAIVMVLLLVVVSGVLDLARAFHAVIVISNAAREGARYLTLHPADKAGGYTGTKGAALAETQNSLITLSSTQVTVTACSDALNDGTCDSGDPIRVRVSYPFRLLTAWFLPSSITLQRSVEMMVP